MNYKCEDPASYYVREAHPFVLAIALALSIASLLVRFQVADAAHSWSIVHLWSDSAGRMLVALACGFVILALKRSELLPSLRSWSGVLFWCTALIGFAALVPMESHSLRAPILGSARWVHIAGLTINTAIPLTLTSLARFAHLLATIASESRRARWVAIAESIAVLVMTLFILLVQPSRSAAFLVGVTATGMDCDRRARTVRYFTGHTRSITTPCDGTVAA